MKQRPILFTSEMVNAILSGRKIQTRRVIKSQPREHIDLGKWETYDDITVGPYEPALYDKTTGEICPGAEIFGAYTTDGEWGARCPYGRPGDQLWVRETWQAWKEFDNVPPSQLPKDKLIGRLNYPTTSNVVWDAKKRPSIHMPRWASRITLTIKDIRAERIQTITEFDAEREGIEDCALLPTHFRYYDNTPGSTRSAVESFRTLWDSINSKRGYGWESNPWVWVIEFKRVVS